MNQLNQLKIKYWNTLVGSFVFLFFFAGDIISVVFPVVEFIVLTKFCLKLKSIGFKMDVIVGWSGLIISICATKFVWLSNKFPDESIFSVELIWRSW